MLEGGEGAVSGLFLKAVPRAHVDRLRVSKSGVRVTNMCDMGNSAEFPFTQRRLREGLGGRSGAPFGALSLRCR